MKKTIKVLCIAMLLSGAAAQAATADHTNISWSGSVNGACRNFAATTAGLSAGAMEASLALMTLQALKANPFASAANFQRTVLYAVATAGLGYVGYKAGNDAVAQAIGEEQVKAAQVSAALGAACILVGINPFAIHAH